MILLVIISKAASASGWVDNEAAAITGHIKKNRKPRIIPVLLDDAAVPPSLGDNKPVDLQAGVTEKIKELIWLIKSGK